MTSQQVIYVKSQGILSFKVDLKMFVKAIGSVITTSPKDLKEMVKVQLNFLSQFYKDFEKTNLPNTRYLYRLDTLTNEFKDLDNFAKHYVEH